MGIQEQNLTEGEKRAIIGAKLEICIAVSFNLQIYTFGGLCYRQMGGGPIGSRLTMAVNKIVMLVWGKKIREALEQAGVTVYSEGCYVDDIRLLISLLSTPRDGVLRRKFRYTGETI